MTKNSDYRTVFSGELGKEVLSDLNKFCFGTTGYIDTAKKLQISESGQVTGVSRTDPLELARFEGRRETLMYILRKIRAKDLEIIENWLDEEEMEF